MAVQGHGTDITLFAGADLSASQFLAVKLNSSGQAVLAGAGEDAVGVLQSKAVAGLPVTVRVAGITKFIAGAAIAAGARVASDADGKAKTAVAASVNTSDAGAAADAVAGSFTLGHALEAAAASGVVIAVLLSKSGAVPTTAA